MAIKEGVWDCSNCTTTHIPGHLKKCPECGDPRNPVLNPEEKPYLPTDAQEVTNPELLDLANAGPDWSCGFCGEANRGDATVCSNCNRPKDYDDTVSAINTYLGGKSAVGVTFDPKSDPMADRIEEDLDAATRMVEGHGEQPRIMDSKILPADALPREGAIADRVDGYMEQAAERKALKAMAPIQRIFHDFRRQIITGGAALGVIAVALFLFFVIRAHFATEPKDLRVTKLEWTRQVEVQEYRTLTESDWNLPSDGRLIGSSQEIRSYDHRFDHYKPETYQDSETVYAGQVTTQESCGSHSVDLGNGFFDEVTDYCSVSHDVYETRYVTKTRDVAVYIDVPIYDTKYVYNVDRWVFDHWETVSADRSQAEPYWPEPQGLSDKQRVGTDQRSEYVVTLQSGDGKQYTQEPNLAVWSELTAGQTVVGNITKNGILRSVNWPLEAKTH